MCFETVEAPVVDSCPLCVPVGVGNEQEQCGSFSFLCTCESGDGER